MAAGRREKDAHPWQQSEAEAAYFISRLSRPAGLVVDPFCGSGTTLVAAKKLGRLYVGFEIDPGTATQARARVAAVRADDSVAHVDVEVGLALEDIE
jgi:site-specific DNA-methyltransferase (adenine-specific)